MKKTKLSLPIDPYLDDIVQDAFSAPMTLLRASPGSGKTTRLPWALVKRAQKKILVLEPRRLAAKLAAQRIADEEDLKLGSEVGYHFRFERLVSNDSKLIFYTEGTFLKTLATNPLLDDVEMVILDEFHERHLETDVALGFLRSIQKKRPDLKLLLMSATLDISLEETFPEAKIIDIKAPHFPVMIHYLPNQPSVLNQSLELKVREALSHCSKEGDVLVFLPGMREMMKMKDYLQDKYGDVFLLHGDLSKEEQELALGENPHRKIILATNIAESSVTIPGIKLVIDSGIQREAHYSPWNGLKIIKDTPVTQSSAIQRAGRAGRTSPGECFRLYSEQDYNSRTAYTVPKILESDLLDTFLLVSNFNITPIWFTPPPIERWLKARELSFKIGAISDEERLTEIGQAMLKYPLSGRLSRVLVAGENLSSEARKKLLNYICQTIEDDRTGTLFKKLSHYLKAPGSNLEEWEKSLLTGFIDQVAKYRKKQNDFIHYSGKTIKAHQSNNDLLEGYYIILDITARQEALKVLPIEEEWLYDIEPFPFTEEETLEVKENLTFRQQTKLGSILIEERDMNLTWKEIDSKRWPKIETAMHRPFQKRWDAWRETETYSRLTLWARLKNKEISSELVQLKDYFESYQTLALNNLEEYFLNRVSEELEASSINLELPESIKLKDHKDHQIYYPLGQDPYIEAPIQYFYGLDTTPTIGKGKIPLTLKLLGPHKRPLQVTKDLENFWKKTYHEMKKELQRDYPRHNWPDDPARAKPFLLKSHVK